MYTNKDNKIFSVHQIHSIVILSFQTKAKSEVEKKLSMSVDHHSSDQFSSKT